MCLSVEEISVCFPGDLLGRSHQPWCPAGHRGVSVTGREEAGELGRGLQPGAEEQLQELGGHCSKVGF